MPGHSVEIHDLLTAHAELEQQSSLVPHKRIDRTPDVRDGKGQVWGLAFATEKRDKLVDLFHTRRVGVLGYRAIDKVTNHGLEIVPGTSNVG